MIFIKNVIFCLFCACAGSAISAGYVAFITMLGVFDKLIEQTKSGKYIYIIESLIIAGVTAGNAIYLFCLRIPAGPWAFAFYNLFGGIFVGCLAGALAETLKIMPILSRRLSIRKFLPYVVAAAALGKGIGCAWQLIIMGGIL